MPSEDWYIFIFVGVIPFVAACAVLLWFLWTQQLHGSAKTQRSAKTGRIVTEVGARKRGADVPGGGKQARSWPNSKYGPTAGKEKEQLLSAEVEGLQKRLPTPNEADVTPKQAQIIERVEATSRAENGASRQDSSIRIVEEVVRAKNEVIGERFDEKEKRVLSPLEKIGYHFVNGKLLQIKNGRPFEFVGQQHYEQLGQAITMEVYAMMREAGLVEVECPLRGGNGRTTQIYVSKGIRDFLSGGGDHVVKVLILVNGSGAVRAGQWARSLIINEHVDLGTMLPYIKKGMEMGYDIIVTNGNDAMDRRARENESPSSHGTYVWKNIVSKLGTNMVAIVAHSAGGYVTVKMASDCRDFQEKVFAIAFTDSAHGYIPEPLKNFFRRVGRNWVTSNKPLGQYLRGSAVTEVSAGHTKHEWTSGIAFPDVFAFLEERESKIVEEQREIEEAWKKQQDEKEKRFSGSQYAQVFRRSGQFAENGRPRDPQVPAKEDDHERKRVNDEVLVADESLNKKAKLEDHAAKSENEEVIKHNGEADEDEKEAPKGDSTAVQENGKDHEDSWLDAEEEETNVTLKIDPKPEETTFEENAAVDEESKEEKTDVPVKIDTKPEENTFEEIVVNDESGEEETDVPVKIDPKPEEGNVGETAIGEESDEHEKTSVEEHHDILSVTTESDHASGFSADEENSSSLHDEM